MRCEHCGSEMTPLLVSVVCNNCDSNRSAGGFDRGWVVWRSRPPGSCEYVFRRRSDAARWRAATGLERFPIRPVLSPAPFRWRKSTGSLRDIELADRLFEIFPDSGFEQGPNRAFLEQ